VPELHKAKVLLLGDGAVGKTSLIRRFVVDQFGDDYITTIGTKVTKKEFQILDGGVTRILAMTIWDVLGQHGYSSVQTTALQGARGVLFVYDVSRPETLENLHAYWFPRLREVAGTVPAIVAGNKVDLAEDRRAATKALEQFAGRHGVPYFLTSARTGEAVEDAFGKLGRACLGYVEAPFEALGVTPAAARADPLVAATDRIMMDFCTEFGGVEAAMPIIKAQASRAGLDVKAPTRESVRRFVENLAEVEKGLRPATKVAANHARRLQWIPRA
jgi:small GTP-binding protein